MRPHGLSGQPVTCQRGATCRKRKPGSAGIESSSFASRPARYVSLVARLVGPVWLGRSTFRPRTAAVAVAVAATAVASVRETRATKVDRGRIRERTQHILTQSAVHPRLQTYRACIQWVCLIIPPLKLYRKSVPGSIPSGLSLSLSLSLACHGTRRPAIYELSHGKVNVGSFDAFPRITVYTYMHYIRRAAALLIFT